MRVYLNMTQAQLEKLVINYTQRAGFQPVISSEQDVYDLLSEEIRNLPGNGNQLNSTETQPIIQVRHDLDHYILVIANPDVARELKQFLNGGDSLASTAANSSPGWPPGSDNDSGEAS